MEKIKEFLTIGYGYGYGSGYGYGYGDGYGDGSGYGDGDGDGSGIKSFKGYTVHYIDGVPTIITRVVNNLAKGFILRQDFTLEQCFITKGNNLFAHGITFAEAVRALEDKIFENMNTVDKIEAFINEVTLDDVYPARFFYEWHHKLTGSCEMGRKNFMRENNIDLDRGEYTVLEFIELTENAFGGDIIKQLKEKLIEEGK